MKRFLLTITIFLGIAGFLSTPVYSQIPTGVVLPSGVPIPGQNCGNPEDPVANRCCFYPPQRVSLPNTNIAPIDVMIDLLSGLFDRILSPVLNPLDELIQKTVQPCINSSPSTPGDTSNPSCICVATNTSPLDNLKPLCDNIDRSKGDGEYNNCIACLIGSSGTVGIWTGMGCIYTDTKAFIQETVLKVGVGLAGGFALLCIIYAAFMMQSSQGNPEKLKKAQEMITSCIMGLMLIIFSVFILKLIGVNILKIPGF
jgi:hypothetical protein